MKYFILILCFTIPIVHSYETKTHSEISLESIKRSVLVAGESIFKDLGLNITEETAAFPSIVPSNPSGAQPANTVFLTMASINRIISGGAALEDADVRSRHHFYDPQNGRVGGAVGHRSPDWILENIIHSQESELIQVSLPGQEFSYRDAQYYYYTALISADEETRQTMFGLMFRSLGHVIHHLQDMAQPQHVRNDPHCDATTDFPGIALLCFFVGLHDPSYFEGYTNDRISYLSLTNPGLSLPNFPYVRDFWDNTTGTGIAQYSNRNFVSASTNYQGNTNGKLSHHPSFSLPAPLDKVIHVSLSDLLNEDTFMSVDDKYSTLQRLGCLSDSQNECIVDFIQNQIISEDSKGLSVINTRSSTISIFDEEIKSRDIEINNNFLSTYRTKRFVSLNRFNFDSAYPFLLPQAVTYSAGLINHFFRGRVEMESIGWSDNSNVMISVKNISEQGNTFEHGKFELYYDSIDGVLKPIKQVSIIGNDLPILVGSSITLFSELPTDLDEESENPIVLVFNALDGQIGYESGIATTRFSLPVKGKVEKIFRLGGKCPGKIVTLRIYFDEQPQNKGRVVILGRESNSMINFGLIPEGIEMIANGRTWFHGMDSATGAYLYVVSNQLPIPEHDPCASRNLGSWVEGENVKAISPLLNE